MSQVAITLSVLLVILLVKEAVNILKLSIIIIDHDDRG
jgi:hypothetical protein